ncbi:MAG: hypothetical protein HC906_01615 [Bacteroidales bacterium]|nr:hypothetical protein [Bacteroidales bacterium]
MIIFSFNQLNAQSDFRNGCIILNNNDTIYGLIDYKGNIAIAKQCVFKKDENSTKQNFIPGEIRGFRFTNSKYYISKSIEVDHELKILFLEYLINGVVDVYYYRDDKGEHYFIEDENGNFHELKNEDKEIVINQTRYLKESKEYINVLKYIFKESPMISKKVDYVGLNHKSLIKNYAGFS